MSTISSFLDTPEAISKPKNVQAHVNNISIFPSFLDTPEAISKPKNVQAHVNIPSITPSLIDIPEAISKLKNVQAHVNKLSITHASLKMITGLVWLRYTQTISSWLQGDPSSTRSALSKAFPKQTVTLCWISPQSYLWAVTIYPVGC